MSMAIDTDSQPRRHPHFWFDDGSLFLSIGNDLFKVHRTLLYRHSRVLPTWPGSYDLADFGINTAGMDGCAIVAVPEDTHATAEDVEALLEHIYHDSPLSTVSSFSRLAAVLRASSPRQFHFPAIHRLSRDLIERMFPSGPQPFHHPNHLEEALALSIEYNIPSIRKGLYYSIVTSSSFDIDTGGSLGLFTDGPVINTETNASALATTSLAQRCTYLMHQIIGHFTPILFTPATSSHMACTDVFADKWMTLVIKPALECDGVYKPLETLQKMIEIDWGKEGLCSACVVEKKAEWKDEQEMVWAKMDEWLVPAINDQVNVSCY